MNLVTRFQCDTPEECSFRFPSLSNRRGHSKANTVHSVPRLGVMIRSSTVSNDQMAAIVRVMQRLVWKREMKFIQQPESITKRLLPTLLDEPVDRKNETRSRPAVPYVSRQSITNAVPIIRPSIVISQTTITSPMTIVSPDRETDRERSAQETSTISSANLKLVFDVEYRAPD